MLDFCIIGSGVSGSTIAHILSKKYNVEIFDKARGLGGRASNKRIIKKQSFDHGVQYISPRSKEFEKLKMTKSNAREFEKLKRRLDGEGVVPKFRSALKNFFDHHSNPKALGQLKSFYLKSLLFYLSLVLIRTWIEQYTFILIEKLE